MQEQIIRFIKKYGWIYMETIDDYREFSHPDFFSISINESEISFVGEWADFLTIPCDIYAVAGALCYHRAIPSNFTFK